VAVSILLCVVTYYQKSAAKKVKTEESPTKKGKGAVKTEEEETKWRWYVLLVLHLFLVHWGGGG
jgi:hypothetical protein